MTDRDALLRAIAENPDDDAPRLVYADWLDEHGDARQAEFIRVQIELARVPGAERHSHPLAARETALWRELRKWRYLIGDWRLFYLQMFDRGFNAVWVGPVAEFLMAEKEFWRKGPVRTLVLDFPSPVPATLTGRVTASPVLGRIWTIRLRGFELSDDWVAEMVSSPHAAAWRQFEAHGDRLTDRTCETLAASCLVASGCRVIVGSAGVSPAGRVILSVAFGDRSSDASRS